MTNLVLYDGLCGLCNSTVQWLLRIDGRRVLTFAPLQGETAKHIPLPPRTSETIVYILDIHSANRKIFVRSEAILEIIQSVGGFWRAALLLRIVPLKLRDTLYDWIARNRYKWFGKYDECRIPSTEVRNRFLS